MKYPEELDFRSGIFEEDDPNFDCNVYFGTIKYKVYQCNVDQEAGVINISDYLRDDYENLISDIAIICEIKRLFQNPASSQPINQVFEIDILNNLDQAALIATYTVGPAADFWFSASPIDTSQFEVETQNPVTGT